MGTLLSEVLAMAVNVLKIIRHDSCEEPFSFLVLGGLIVHPR